MSNHHAEEFAAEMPDGWQGEQYPPTPGECIDLAYTLREERLLKTKEVKNLKFREEQLRNHIYATFGEDGLTGARGIIASCSIGEELRPVVGDWEQVYAYVRDTNHFELLEKRMARIAYRERYDNGIIIPGTEPFLYPKMSLTKLSRKGK